MPWTLKSLTIGWPPSVEMARIPGAKEALSARFLKEKEALNTLFIFLEDKRLLRYGYGMRSGITDVQVLAGRVDDIRARLLIARAHLEPSANVTKWLSKLQEACHELVDKASGALPSSGTAPDSSEIVPAVDQLRGAFRLLATSVYQVYALPASQSVADRISENLASRPDASS